MNWLRDRETVVPPSSKYIAEAERARRAYAESLRNRQRLILSPAVKTTKREIRMR